MKWLGRSVCIAFTLFVPVRAMSDESSPSDSQITAETTSFDTHSKAAEVVSSPSSEVSTTRLETRYRREKYKKAYHMNVWGMILCGMATGQIILGIGLVSLSVFGADAAVTAGGVLTGAGGVSFLVGLPLWIIGHKRRNRYAAVMPTLTFTTGSKGRRGLAISFYF